MDAWAQKSDEAARDVSSIMCGMLGFRDVQTKIRQPGEPQRPAQTKNPSRLVIEIVSELGSREGLLSQHSVSDIGAETEPQWLLAATQKGSWPPCATQAGAQAPTKQTTVAKKNISRRDGREVTRTGTYQPPGQTHVQPLPNYPESTQLSPPTKTPVVISPFYPRPQAQRRTYQAPSRSTAPPKVTIQVPLVQSDQPPEKHVPKIGELPCQHHTRPPNMVKPLPALPLEASAPYCPPLTALLYFSLELPRSRPHHNGSYLRHHAHPMRLPLANPQQLVASIAHLRGYLTEQPARFLSHFASYISPPKSSYDDEKTRLVVHFPSLFRPAGGFSRVEKIWGKEMAWAWADASEGRFAEAVVGVLREVAEVMMREGKGGGEVVDVSCVVREVVDGRKGYGLLMDVRRIGEEKTRMSTEQKKEKEKKKEKKKAAEKERRESCVEARQMGGRMVEGGEEKMWIH